MILPAVSGDMMHCAPRFRPQPLRAILAFVAERYDAAKRRVARTAAGGNVMYVDALPEALAAAHPRARARLFSAADGVHPSRGRLRLVGADWIVERAGREHHR